MTSGKEPLRVFVFSTQLGWMGMVCSDRSVRQLTFGHPNAAAVAQALGNENHLQASRPAPRSSWETDLIRQLQAYAAGWVGDFTDVAVDPGSTSRFQRRIYALCRQIPYGATMTYGELARLAGSPRGARAVGQCLARNPIPLLIPCHRVVGADGKLGGFSAPGGLAMKQRLLQLEAVADQTDRSCFSEAYGLNRLAYFTSRLSK